MRTAFVNQAERINTIEKQEYDNKIHVATLSVLLLQERNVQDRLESFQEVEQKQTRVWSRNSYHKPNQSRGQATKTGKNHGKVTGKSLSPSSLLLGNGDWISTEEHVCRSTFFYEKNMNVRIAGGRQSELRPVRELIEHYANRDSAARKDGRNGQYVVRNTGQMWERRWRLN